MWLLKPTDPIADAFLRSFLQNFSHELTQMIRFCVVITCSGQFYFVFASCLHYSDFIYSGAVMRLCISSAGALGNFLES